MLSFFFFDSLLLVNRATRPQFPDQSDKINHIKLEMPDKEASYGIESTYGQEKHYYTQHFSIGKSRYNVLITAFVQTVLDHVEQTKTLFQYSILCSTS